MAKSAASTIKTLLFDVEYLSPFSSNTVVGAKIFSEMLSGRGSGASTALANSLAMNNTASFSIFSRIDLSTP